MELLMEIDIRITGSQFVAGHTRDICMIEFGGTASGPYFHGEVIGTGVIGAILSYPVMTFLWGKEGLSWLFYVPSFICGTLIGGSIAYVFLRKFAANGMLARIQTMLGSQSYLDHTSILSNTLTIAAFGAILFVVIELASDIFKLTGALWDKVSYFALILCAAAAILYYITKKVNMTHAPGNP